jgi:nucleotide-binding universal stress UspA family protein
MSLQPSVLCPVDFSDSSRGALRYAAAIAAHFGARLTLLAVVDPLLQEAAELTGEDSQLPAVTAREVERFFAATLDKRPDAVPEVRTEVTIGKAAPEILRVARDSGADVIVMSSHGSTGFRKLFFGSTTERVLRETQVPVLVTPGWDHGPEQLEDVPRLVRRVLAPVDLTAATPHQLNVTRGLARALNLPLLLLHVVEPVRSMFPGPARLPSVDAERRTRAEAELEDAVGAMPPGAKAEALIAYGEPAEEIAKVSEDRDAGLIVMGLHSSPLLGPRMGSVTYRVLCVARRLLLALPPAPAAVTGPAVHREYACVRPLSGC